MFIRREKTSGTTVFDRYDYLMDETTFAIAPFKRAEIREVCRGQSAERTAAMYYRRAEAGGSRNPWSWQGCYWDHEPQQKSNCSGAGFTSRSSRPIPASNGTRSTRGSRKSTDSRRSPVRRHEQGRRERIRLDDGETDKVSCIYADNPAIRPEAFVKLVELAKNDVALPERMRQRGLLLQRHTLPIEIAISNLAGASP